MTQIRILTITHKTPEWICAGYAEYAKRMPPYCQLELVEIAAEKRNVNANLQRIMEREGEKILANIKPSHYIIALDIAGKLWSTETLASMMREWRQTGKHIDLLVGGPEGLALACKQKAHALWSLSPLTFPHFLVRVIVAEQLYRVCTLLQNHPYHR